jgi:hypothetical protein
MEFIDEPENEAFEFYLERELDFSSYDRQSKYEFDFDKVTCYDKPKLNRNNIQFHSYFDKFIFDAIPLKGATHPLNPDHKRNCGDRGLRGELSPLDIYDALDGKDTNHFEQQDCESISEWNDDGLYFSDPSDRSEEETQSTHSGD